MSRDDRDVLLNAGIEVALDLIEKNGEFYPFAVAKSPAGEVVHVRAHGGEERPRSEDLLVKLIEALAGGAREGTYVATAIVWDARMTDMVTGRTGDTICIELEDGESAPARCFLPYEREDRTVIPGMLVAQTTAKRVFA